MLQEPNMFLQAFFRKEEITNAQVEPMKLCALTAIETIWEERVAHTTLGGI